MIHPAEHSPLGQATTYVQQYDPALLFAVPRMPKWAELGLSARSLPYQGMDIWTCYELSWLWPSGRPAVAVGEFFIPADSPNLIESKSFKLYLNSLNQTVFSSRDQLCRQLREDLSAATGKPVSIRLYTLDEFSRNGIVSLPGVCIDELDIRITAYDRPDPGLLRCSERRLANQQLHSHLLKSNCPVTGQPDWASVAVQYTGKALEPDSLLAYLVSFRQHADFHEQCVEQIFMDLLHLLEPDRLSVHARYTRRGGLDINPCRSTHPVQPVSGRLVRQ